MHRYLVFLGFEVISGLSSMGSDQGCWISANPAGIMNNDAGQVLLGNFMYLLMY